MNIKLVLFGEWVLVVGGWQIERSKEYKYNPYALYAFVEITMK
jgi:hypothetical protein